MGLTGSNSTIDTNGLGATFGGVMSGTGGFVKSGPGTLSLTAANTYTGVTTISGGTLQIGDGGTGGSIIGDVVDNGRLPSTGPTPPCSPGDHRHGRLDQDGAGILTLAGPGSYTGATFVNTGALRAGAANVFSPSSAVTGREWRDARPSRLQQQRRLACGRRRRCARIGDARQRKRRHFDDIFGVLSPAPAD